MRAEVIGVGTELLLGDIANTNAQEIGGMLAAAGIDCVRHVAVGDNEERIAAAIASALADADAAIVTGGLGPTQDDVTREAICRVTGDTLVRDPALEDRLRRTFERMRRPMADSNLRQADRPSRATAIETRIGTAPGLVVEHDGGVVYAIPGVPAEMREMMERTVVPDLLRRAGEPASVASRVLRVVGIAESALADALSDVWTSIDGTPVTMAFLAGGGEIRVRLTAKAPSRDDALRLVEPVERIVRDVCGSALVGADGDTLESVVGSLLRARGWTIACAESLTGGLAGGRLTRVEGSSEWFRGSLVTYATDAKTAILGVDAAIIEQFGVVSEEVAAAMAAGARRALDADVGLAYTGVAGPGDGAGAARGTVCLGVDGPLGAVTRTTRLPGERETVRTLAVAAGINLVRLYLMEALA